jgi:tetratricopeptide (TPR) repeat protein
VAIDRDRVLEAAQAFVEKKRYDKAIVEYQKILAADPKDARTLLKIGEAYLKAEQFERAIGTFEQVAELHAAQGFALKAVAAYVQAREIVQRQVPHLTDRFGYLVPRIAELYVQLQRNNDAIQIYEETATRLEAAGRHRDAIDILKKIVELDPRSADRAYRLAEGLIRLGDTESAVPHLGTAAEGLVARGQHDDAIALLERALSVRGDPKLARQAAQLYLDRGGPKDAASAFLKIQIAYKHAPKDLDTLGLLARALYVLRQPDRAIDVHKEAARVARENNNEAVFDQHMDTLITRAPNDPVVRKLAAGWAKAPAWVHEPVAAPPGPRLPQPPPRAPHAAPTPPHAPSMPPHAPPYGHAPPVPPAYGYPPAPPMPPHGHAPPTPPPFEHAPPMPPHGYAPPTPQPFEHAPAPQPFEHAPAPPPFEHAPPAPHGHAPGAPRMPPPLPPRARQQTPLPVPGPLPGAPLTGAPPPPPHARQHTPLPMPGPLPGGPPMAPPTGEQTPPPQRAPLHLIPRMTPPTPPRGHGPPPPPRAPSPSSPRLTPEPPQRLSPPVPFGAVTPIPMQPAPEHARPSAPIPMDPTPFGHVETGIPSEPPPFGHVETSIPSEPPFGHAPMAMDAPFGHLETPIPAMPAAAPYLAPEIPAIDAPDLPDLDTPSGSWDGPKSFAGRGGFDEEALEEVEFFVAQGMFEDAIGILDEQLERLPGHPLLLDRKREVEELAAAEGG